jgi:AcrR family transcriptional regulator
VTADHTSSKPRDPLIEGGALLEPIDGVRRRSRRRQAPSKNVGKRQKIIRGAQEVFLALGFDAASMDDIARAAGVSAGTLYRYFENKEQLFHVVCKTACAQAAEIELSFDGGGRDLEVVLTRFGIDMVTSICRPDRVSLLRILIPMAGRMPEIGNSFFQAMPAPLIARLVDFLKRQVETGVLAVDDCELAGEQLVDACHSTLLKPMILGSGAPPTRERIRYVVTAAVSAFLAGYGRRR